MKRDLFEELKEGFQALQDARSRHPISNEAEYQAALLEIESYFNNNEPEPSLRIKNNDPEMKQFCEDLLISVKEMKS